MKQEWFESKDFDKTIAIITGSPVIWMTQCSTLRGRRSAVGAVQLSEFNKFGDNGELGRLRRDWKWY